MSETIYLVSGSTGEYSDRRDWVVRAFRSKENAQGFVVTCENFVQKHWPDGDKSYYEHPFSCKHEGGPDPSVHMDYTGTEYSIEEVELA